MKAFISDLELSAEKHRPEKFSDFRKVLERVGQHPNPRYFILKSIIVNNLFGVDIMEEAVEICKLRLFLKLVAQVEQVENIEPLPDIDFNIRAGNTLVGFANYDEVKKAVTSKLDFDNTMKRIEEKAQDIDRLFGLFRQQQTELGGEVTPDDKQELRNRLRVLEDELNRYLAGEYGVSVGAGSPRPYEQWLASHKPFHWFIEFYGIINSGGFDVIIGNPPYVEYSKVKNEYTVLNYETESCGNLYVFVMERAHNIRIIGGRLGLILPISLTAAQRIRPLQEKLLNENSVVYLSNFGLRPAALFPGIMQRLTICLTCNGKKSVLYTTDYITWYTEERDILFKAIQYISSNGLRLSYSIPKINNPIAQKALLKVRSVRMSGNYQDFKGDFCIYYHNAGGYWIKTFDFPPYYRSIVNPNKRHTTISELRLPNEDLTTIYLCVLNSSLFYFFWKSLTDARHLYPSDVAMFPIELPLPPNLINRLCLLRRNLMQAYRINSERIVYGRAEVDQFNVFPCKPIIDEIDRALAQHYGFTDEELDFIINYDIKYRMGLDNMESEGE